MNTVSILIKTEPEVKKRAQQAAKNMGSDLNSILTAFLKQFIKTQTIDIHTTVDEIPNAYFKKMVKKAQADRKAGKASPIFDNAEDAIAWLHK